MRPQRFSCGCASERSAAAIREGGFNEAAAIQLRMPGLLLGGTFGALSLQ